MITDDLRNVINNSKKVHCGEDPEFVDKAIINTPSVFDKITNGLVNIWEIVIARAFMYVMDSKKNYPDKIFNNAIRLCVMNKDKKVVFDTRIYNGMHKKVMIDKNKCELKTMSCSNEVTVYLKINENSDYISNKFKQVV